MDKKSHLFLLTYGLFLLASCYLFGESTLSKISLAASLSGICFAISDFLWSPAEDIKKSLSGIISNLEDMEAKCLDAGCKNAEIIADNLDTVQQDIIDSKRNAHRLLKRANKMLFAGKFLFCFGVFTFLVVVVGYDEIIRALYAIKGFETRSTILAFGVIMLNYYMQDWILEKASNVLKKYNI